jgi:hypothetical protein
MSRMKEQLATVYWKRVSLKVAVRVVLMLVATTSFDAWRRHKS